MLLARYLRAFVARSYAYILELYTRLQVELDQQQSKHIRVEDISCQQK